MFTCWLERQAGGERRPRALEQRAVPVHRGQPGRSRDGVSFHWLWMQSCSLANTSHQFSLEACDPAAGGTVQQHPGAQLYRGHLHQLPSCCVPFRPPRPAALTQGTGTYEEACVTQQRNAPQQIKWLQVLCGSRPPKWKRFAQELWAQWGQSNIPAAAAPVRVMAEAARSRVMRRRLLPPPAFTPWCSPGHGHQFGPHHAVGAGVLGRALRVRSGAGLWRGCAAGGFRGRAAGKCPGRVRRKEAIGAGPRAAAWETAVQCPLSPGGPCGRAAVAVRAAEAGPSRAFTWSPPWESGVRYPPVPGLRLRWSGGRVYATVTEEGLSVMSGVAVAFFVFLWAASGGLWVRRKL